MSSNPSGTKYAESGMGRLSPIDPEHPRPPSPLHHSSTAHLWDTETDHMLSYFLGGDPIQCVMPDFIAPESEPGGEENDHVRRHAPPPPPTPIVQHFYASRTPSTSHEGKTGGCIKSMAAALVHGGPMVTRHLHQQQKHKNSSSTLATADSITQDNPSPLSPAAFIGMEHENLLLPPSTPDFNENTTMMMNKESVNIPHASVISFPTSHSQSDTSSNPMQPHPQPPPPPPLTWLQDVNTRASMMVQPAMIAYPSDPQHNNAVMQPPAAPGTVPVVPVHTTTGGTVPMTVPMMGYYTQIMSQPTHNPFFYAVGQHQQQQQQQQQQQDMKSPVETEEKRVKRLERNRESARKSRRKKKERLSSLEAQVNKLHQDIEEQRRYHIGTMVGSMKSWRRDEILKCGGLEGTNDHIQAIVHLSGPNSSVSRSVLAYQYNRLLNLTLPGYQKFLLWAILQEESFFTFAKEEYARRESGGRSTGNKVSSKQIGEDLFAAGTRVESTEKDALAAGQFASCYATDKSLMWPLVCGEFKFSVDQEDKFLTYRRKQRDVMDLCMVQDQMNAALRTVASLRNAVDSVSRAIAHRETKVYVQTMTAKQNSIFQSWLVSNREQCAIVQARTITPTPSSNDAKDASLHDICRRLNEVLRISQAQ